MTHSIPSSCTHRRRPHKNKNNSCLYLINAFSLLIDASESLTDIGGLAARLAELLLALEAETESSASPPLSYLPPAVPPPPAAKGENGRSSSTNDSAGPPLLTLEGVSLRLPDGRWLLRDFALTVRGVCI